MFPFLLPDYSGGTDSITVNIPGAWQIVGKPSWVSVSDSAGTGSTVINVTVGENTGGTRSGYIIIYDNATGITYAVLINETGLLDTPFLSVDPETVTVPASGGTYQTTITYNQRYSDTITINYSDTAITYTPNSIAWGNDQTTLYVSIARNTAGSALTHTITYSGVSNEVSVQQIFTQEYEDYANVDTNPINFTYESGTTTINIDSNVSWTATTNDSWISFTPTSGAAGNRVLRISVQENGTASARTGYIYIRKISDNTLLETITINQSTEGETLIVVPTLIEFDATGGTATFSITSNTNWTIEEI